MVKIVQEETLLRDGMTVEVEVIAIVEDHHPTFHVIFISSGIITSTINIATNITSAATLIVRGLVVMVMDLIYNFREMMVRRDLLVKVSFDQLRS
jgi:hypothetical protein